MNKIPVSKPDISSLEKAYAVQAINSGWISSNGPFVQKFEQAWADYNKMDCGVACNSGTNALYLAFKALGLKAGDEVIVPEFTMVATAWAVTYTGATPVFVDCGNDLLINPRLIEAKITHRTKAICPVHIYGRRCNMDVIMALAKKYGLKVVEDSAEAHGIRPVGDVACYSFFGNKIVTTGEGGMCLTNDDKLAHHIRLLANMWFDPGHTFLHPGIGHNHRMTNVQAAIGLGQVERIHEILVKRRLIERWYDEVLTIGTYIAPREVLWMYDINLGIHRDRVRAELTEIGVDTRLFFKPMSMQPMYHGAYESLLAYKWSRIGLYLPTSSAFEEWEIKLVAHTVKNVLAGVSR